MLQYYISSFLEKLQSFSYPEVSGVSLISALAFLGKKSSCCSDEFSV